MRYPARRRSVVLRVPEELPRRALRHYPAVKQHRASVRRFGAELKIVADNEDGFPLVREPSEKPPEFIPEPGVRPLCRLVEEQNVRPGEQEHRDTSPLCLAAGQIIRMPVEKSAETAYTDCFRELIFIPGNTGELVLQRVFREERSRLLREHRGLRLFRDKTALRLYKPCEQTQCRGLSASVPADESGYLSAPDLQRQVAHNLPVAVSEADVFGGENDVAARPFFFFRQSEEPVLRREPADKLSRRAHASLSDTHIRREGGFQSARSAADVTVRNLPRDICRSSFREYFSVVNHDRTCRRRQSLVETVLGHYHGRPELAVHSDERREQLVRRDRVKPARRLVEDEYFRSHHHHRGEAQELFLPARQRGRVRMKPPSDAEE